MIWFLLVVYWLFILWEFLAAAKVQQKNETNKKISNIKLHHGKSSIVISDKRSVVRFDSEASRFA